MVSVHMEHTGVFFYLLDAVLFWSCFRFYLLYEIVQMTTYSKKFIAYIGQTYIDFILCMSNGKALQYLSNKLHSIKPMKIFIFLSGQNFFGQTCPNSYTFPCMCACVNECVCMSDFAKWLVHRRYLFIFSLGQTIPWKWNTKRCVNSFRFIHLRSSRQLFEVVLTERISMW